MTAGALEQACRERGIRLSTQRRIILEALETAHDHPCAYDVHQRVALRHRKISVATVYRALNGFTQAGLLVRRDFGDGRRATSGRRQSGTTIWSMCAAAGSSSSTTPN